jgi:hypothetical protein
MLRLTSRIFVASLILASTNTARSQSTNDSRIAQEQFREHIVCAAYWKIQTQCLPSFVPPHQKESAQQMFEKLVSTANTITEWLGDKAQLSPDAQQRIEQQTKDRVFGSIGGKCESAPNLIPVYRDKCAALFTANGDKLKAEYEAKKKDDLSDAQSVKDTEMDCTGTLQNHEEEIPPGKEHKANAYVHVMGGGVLMLTIKPQGMPEGMLTGQIIGAKPNYLRYNVTLNTFKIGRSEPKFVGVDRVNAEVAVMLQGEKSYTFWFKCKVRKPQF